MAPRARAPAPRAGAARVEGGAAAPSTLVRDLAAPPSPSPLRAHRVRATRAQADRRDLSSLPSSPRTSKGKALAAPRVEAGLVAAALVDVPTLLAPPCRTRGWKLDCAVQRRVFFRPASCQG